MDTSNLPLVKRCTEKAEEFEILGDSANADKWLELAMKAEIYYSKQNYQTAEEYYKGKNV